MKSLRNILYISLKGINVERFAFHLKVGLFFFLHLVILIRALEIFKY